MDSVGLGTYKLLYDECYNIVKKAIELGYRLIDTATLYGNHVEIGRAIKDSGIDRSELFITSKIHKKYIKNGKIEEGFNTILEELNVEYIDLLLLHEPYKLKDAERKNIEIWRKMELICRSEKAKNIGVSNFRITEIKNILDYCSIKPYINQIEVSPFCQRKKLISFCKENGIKIEAYRSLTNGEKFTNEKIITLSRKYDISVPKLLLYWAKINGYHIIPKADNYEQLVENLSLKSLELADFDLNDFMDLNEDYFTMKQHSD